jgi:signal transduction histidine kinase
MRVLHHEIVNSITPIISLSDSVHSALKDPTSGMTNDEVIEASSAILKRSKGLLKFSKGYRTLTDIPTITTTLIQPAEILEKTVRLFGDVRQKQIRTIIETRAMITADESQIEQVLINLIKNAIESVPENKTPEIQLLISEQAHELRISVSDNGIGMNDEVLANIYVPYFTTKKEGQGIGMSLCRQFVLANKGKIYIASTPEQGTTVQLAFPVAV